MQHILITGGNTGIGKATAIALAKKGAKIIIACRNEGKAKKAVEEIRVAAQQDEVYSLICDLASFDSIRKAAKKYHEEYGQLDILINNAGLFTDNLQFTEDGFELQIGVNHLGHFLWTKLLLELLQKSSEPRIINVSSMAHYKAKVNFNTFKGEIGEDKYKGMAAYGQSKLANVLFTKELAKRHPNVCSHSLHPGVVSTEIVEKHTAWFYSIISKLLSPFMINPTKGAQTSVYLASSKDVLGKNGLYFEKSKVKEPSDLAKDNGLAQQLWEISERLVN